MLAYDILCVVILDDCKLFRDVAQSRSVSKGASLNGIVQQPNGHQLVIEAGLMERLGDLHDVF